MGSSGLLVGALSEGRTSGGGASTRTRPPGDACARCVAGCARALRRVGQPLRAVPMRPPGVRAPHTQASAE
eukprot:4771124-Prymnesium_polylepis.2